MEYMLLVALQLDDSVKITELFHADGAFHALTEGKIAKWDPFKLIVSTAHIAGVSSIDTCEHAHADTAKDQISRENAADVKEKDSHEIEDFRVSLIIKLARSQILV